MKNIIALFVLSMVSSIAVADINNCQNLYVGQVVVGKGIGLNVVTFLAGPNDGDGSSWVSFADWTSDDKKSALALLTSAKMSGHRVNFSTDGLSGCGITNGTTNALNINLAQKP